MSNRLPTEERQAGIIQAVLGLMQTTSPAQVTTADVAAAIGVSQGAVFKHFPTKDAIWAATLAWVREALLDRLSESAALADSPLAALGRMFSAHVAFVGQHPGVPRLIFHELQQPGDTLAKVEVRQLLRDYRGLLLEVIAACGQAGEVPATLDREAAATAFFGLLQGLVMQSMMAGRPGIDPAHAERVLTLYLQGLQGPGTAPRRPARSPA